MISKLKSECGHQYTSKLEGMFNDITLSDELMKHYKTFLSGSAAAGSSSRPRPSSSSAASSSATAAPAPSSGGGGAGGGGIELKVSVLTSGFWPGAPGTVCELPPEITECCTRFETFYLGRHNGRRLTWQPQHGMADIKAVLGSSRHELSVSSYQMCILMLFNSHPRLSWQEIVTRTKIPTDELKRHLLSLYVNPKAKILVKSGGGGGEKDKNKEPQDDDIFEVNTSFESRMIRVKVPLIVARAGEGGQRQDDGGTAAASSSAAPGSDVPSSVEEDRKHLVEAVVVRVMKSRKTLEHNNLVLEVTKMLAGRFHPSPQLIKQRIEKLIEREYLERSQTDRRTYNYLA